MMGITPMLSDEHVDRLAEHVVSEWDEPIPFPDSAWPKLRAGLQFVADEPLRLNMSDWIIRFPEHPLPFSWIAGLGEQFVAVRGGMPPCRTVVCLSGAIVIAEDPDAEIGDMKSSLDVLGLDTTYQWFESDRENRYEDPVADRLVAIYGMTYISTYAQLCRVLQYAFTFPGELPAERVIIDDDARTYGARVGTDAFKASD